MKRVLLTGASGFIGCNAIAPLVSRGHEVHAVTHAGREGTASDDVTWHRADLLDADQVSRLLAFVRPTHLLHFAWAVEPGKFWTSPDNERWMRASIGLVRSFAAQGGRRLAVAGTCAEYDWSAAGGLLSERDSTLAPATPYGRSKQALHDVVDELVREFDLGVVWGRIFFPYGPREPRAKFVASVTRALLHGEPALCTHGNQVRDFMHVRDVADAFVALLDSDARGPVNIASGEPVTLRDVATRIGEIVGRPDLLRFGALPGRAGEPERLVADVERLRNEVDWRPSLALKDGLNDTVEWWKRNEDHDRH